MSEEEELREIAAGIRLRNDASQRWALAIRRLARNGELWSNPRSRFDAQEPYLPLDLWDETPDAQPLP